MNTKDSFPFSSPILIRMGMVCSAILMGVTSSIIFAITGIAHAVFVPRGSNFPALPLPASVGFRVPGP